MTGSYEASLLNTKKLPMLFERSFRTWLMFNVFLEAINHLKNRAAQSQRETFSSHQVWLSAKDKTKTGKASASSKLPISSQIKLDFEKKKFPAMRRSNETFRFSPPTRARLSCQRPHEQPETSQNY